MKLSLKVTNLDAAENAFFSRQLESIRAKAYEVAYPELMAMKLIPMKTDIHIGAKEYTYEYYDSYGTAEFVTDYQKFGPSVSVAAGSDTVKLRGIKDSYVYSIEEARNAMMARSDLIDRKAKAARRVIAQKLDDIMILGDGSASYMGLYGIAKLSGTVTSTTLGAWSGLTVTQLLTELNGFVSKIVNDSKGVEVPDTLAMPLASFNFLNEKMMDTASSMTVLSWFKANNPYIRNIFPVPKLETAGAASVKRAICYKRDPEKIEGLLPIEFEQFLPQEQSTALITECHAKTGGVVAPFPKSVSYLDHSI